MSYLKKVFVRYFEGSGTAKLLFFCVPRVGFKILNCQRIVIFLSMECEKMRLTITLQTGVVWMVVCTCSKRGLLVTPRQHAWSCAFVDSSRPSCQKCQKGDLQKSYRSLISHPISLQTITILLKLIINPIVHHHKHHRSSKILPKFIQPKPCGINKRKAPFFLTKKIQT